jgi:hypothetical protein
MKTIYELSIEEIDELRERYIIELDIDHDNISNEEVMQYYAETYFVEEDFFCNIKDLKTYYQDKLKRLKIGKNN